MLDPKQKVAATNLLNNIRNMLLESPVAHRATNALVGAGAGYLGANLANTIIPDQYDINPLLAAGVGAVGGGVFPLRRGVSDQDVWASPPSRESVANAQAAAANQAAYNQRYGQAGNPAIAPRLPGSRPSLDEKLQALDDAMASSNPRSLQQFAQSYPSNSDPWDDLEIY